MLDKSSFYKKKIIIFDLDGTIVDLDVDWKYLKNILRNRYSAKYKEYCEFRSISDCLNQIVKKKDEEELLEIFKIVEDFEIKTINKTRPINEVISFIKNISNLPFLYNIKLAVFSLNTRKTIIQALTLFNIFNKFDFIIGKEDVRYWKPNPEGLLKIRSFFDVEKEDMIYFGDTERDLITGINANIDSVLIYDLIEFIVNNYNF